MPSLLSVINNRKVKIMKPVHLNNINSNKLKSLTGDSQSGDPINESVSIPLILPDSLESRRKEFLEYVNAARANIISFAKEYGWEDFTKVEFMERVIIFDNKNEFDLTLLKLAEADTSEHLPDTYCAALEKRTLISVTPEYFSEVYPEGNEERSFEKLLTHEIAHSLHIRILNGEEKAMGPIWFYEGFAIYAADQFSKSDVILSNEEMIKIMKDPVRESYVKYNYIFRYFVNIIPLKELIFKAKDEHFNDELILMLI